ncbi:MAG TPA: tetratricopeptide repeat protein [Geobacteraceae bacterium]
MIIAERFRSNPKRTLVVGLLFVLLLATPAFPLEAQDTQLFVTGINAYQKKDYPAAIDTLSQVLKKYPDTSLRDLVLFWLAQSNFKAGNKNQAARFLTQFFKEYPDSPLRKMVVDELAALVGKQ